MSTWISSLALAFLMLPSSALAFGGHGPKAHHGKQQKRMRMLRRALHKADLSDDQKEQLKELHKKHRAAMKKFRQSKMKKGNLLLQLLEAEDPSEVQLKSAQVHGEAQRKAHQALMFRHYKAMVQILEPEQRKVVAEELRRMGKIWRQKKQQRRERRMHKRKRGGHGGFDHEMRGDGDSW